MGPFPAGLFSGFVDTARAGFTKCYIHVKSRSHSANKTQYSSLKTDGLMFAFQSPQSPPPSCENACFTFLVLMSD